MLKLSFVKSAILAVLVALVTCGFSTSAFAKPSKPVVVHPGDAEVEVDNDGEVDVDLGDSPSKPDEDGPAIMQDDFTAAKKAKPEPVDTDSVIEIALRGVVVPGTGPALGGTLGFSWRPANRYRVYGGFNGSKGLIDLSGQEKELFQFGFTVGGSYAITRTVEIGLFGNGTGNGAIRFIHDEAKDLDKRVDKLEKKQAYFAGIGTALGVAAGIVGDHLKTFLFHHL